MTEVVSFLAHFILPVQMSNIHDRFTWFSTSPQEVYSEPHTYVQLSLDQYQIEKLQWVCCLVLSYVCNGTCVKGLKWLESKAGCHPALDLPHQPNVSQAGCHTHTHTQSQAENNTTNANYIMLHLTFLVFLPSQCQALKRLLMAWGIFGICT